MTWHIANAAPREADVYIFDVIGDPWGGTVASDFVKEVRGLDVDRINLHINSPGGYVDDALAMYAAIQQHTAEVVAHIVVAASAASFVAMAANRVLISKNGKMFIHDAHGFGFGNAADFHSLAELLEEESDNIASIYAEKTEKETAEWRQAMLANGGNGTTYRGQAAVDAGLADEMESAPAKNVMPGRIAALQREQGQRNTGRTMSQANLDNLHAAMGGLGTVHDGTCDMGGDCPLGSSDDGADGNSGDTDNEYGRRFVAALKGA